MQRETCFKSLAISQISFAKVLSRSKLSKKKWLLSKSSNESSPHRLEISKLYNYIGF